MDKQETGGADHRIDDETGLPFWELWGEGWKDSEKMSVGEPMALDAKSFPPGTRVVIIEPAMEDPRTDAFYEASAKREDYYPLNGAELEEVLALNDDE